MSEREILDDLIRKDKWTKWATKIVAEAREIDKGLDKLIKLRDCKTVLLMASICFLIAALFGYALTIGLLIG